jgi:hypothetical protein
MPPTIGAAMRFQTSDPVPVTHMVGAPITDQPNDTWGASFGGRVWIPKLYDGKNKTFFYLGYEHYDDTQSSSSVFATPTAAEIMGDFSKTLASKGGLLTIYDPLTVVNGARQPFPGNIIAANRLHRALERRASGSENPTLPRC